MKFSIRAILVLTAFVALVFAALVVFPPVLAYLALMLVHTVMTSVLVGGAVYGRNGTRAFCIGAAAVVCPAMGWIIWEFGSDFIEYLFDSSRGVAWQIRHMETTTATFKRRTITVFVIAPVAGCIVMLIRRLLRPGDDVSHTENRVE